MARYFVSESKSFPFQNPQICILSPRLMKVVEFKMRRVIQCRTCAQRILLTRKRKYILQYLHCFGSQLLESIFNAVVSIKKIVEP